MALVSALGSFLSVERLLDRSSGCGPKTLFEPSICPNVPSRSEFKILFFIFCHHNYIPYLLDQKSRLLIFSLVAERGYILRAATIQEQCLLMI